MNERSITGYTADVSCGTTLELGPCGKSRPSLDLINILLPTQIFRKLFGNIFQRFEGSFSMVSNPILQVIVLVSQHFSSFTRFARFCAAPTFAALHIQNLSKHLELLRRLTLYSGAAHAGEASPERVRTAPPAPHRTLLESGRAKLYNIAQPQRSPSFGSLAGSETL